MGVLLSNPHPAVRNMFVTLTQDPFANDVLTQVANGAFGPRALARYATEHDAAASSSDRPSQYPSTIDPSNHLSDIQPLQGGPTNDWQLQTVRTVVARSQTLSGSILILGQCIGLMNCTDKVPQARGTINRLSVSKLLLKSELRSADSLARILRVT
jgi:hypothetical protein